MPLTKLINESFPQLKAGMGNPSITVKTVLMYTQAKMVFGFLG